MRITFVLPGYPTVPVGGFRIVYQYANYLVGKGHAVTVVHARYCQPFVEPPLRWPSGIWRILRHERDRYLVNHPKPITWQSIDPRVNLLYLPEEPTADQIPDGDAIFATAWKTAPYVWNYPPRTGVPCYLIQHWETWSGSEGEVAATWLLPMHKVVISQWLFDWGIEIGANDMVHIPNALDHNVFRVHQAITDRKPSIVSLYHGSDWKGVGDALIALHRLHEVYPEIPVTFFGAIPRGSDLPRWIRYIRKPQQSVLVRDLYNGHSIYLGASWAEGWALPPAEAMACGCAFVGTDIGGFRDYAIDGQTALLSPPRDPHALFQNLCRVVEDSDLRHTLQHQGQEFIQQFTWDRSGMALERALQQWVRQV